VIAHVAGRVPILCVAGDVAPGLDLQGLDVVGLVGRVGLERARAEVVSLIEQVVAEYVSSKS
jgi:hypothetical protein